MERVALGAGIAAVILGPYLWWKTRQAAAEVTRFRAAFEHSPTPLFLKDPKGAIVAINAAFTDAFGLTMEDLAGLTAEQQHALWASSPAVNFDETDRLAYSADEVIYSVAHLVPPNPHRSQLMNPHTPQEYFISKRRFLVQTPFSSTHWLICSVKSIELMIQFAEKARSRYEEIQMKSPILSAIHDLKDLVQQGFADGSDRMTRIEDRLTKTEASVRVLQGTEKTQPIDMFEDFVKPS